MKASIGPNVTCDYVDEDGNHFEVTIVSSNGHGFWCCREKNGPIYIAHENNLTPMPSIPSRFKITTFRRVAPILGAALRAFPNAISIECGKLSPDTVARLLRDAIAGKQKYGHSHPDVDELLWTANIDKICVSLTVDGLFIGPIEAIKEKSLSPAASIGTVAIAEVPPVRFIPYSTNEFEFLCSLISNKAFHPPIVFLVKRSAVKDYLSSVEDIENRYDVVFSEVEPDDYEIR